jgi:hypothetical protein
VTPDGGVQEQEPVVVKLMSVSAAIVDGVKLQEFAVL